MKKNSTYIKRRKRRTKLESMPLIAVTDSGAGGLFVLKKLRQAFPSLNLLYVSDSKNMPYGQKSNSQIIDLCKANYKKAKAAGAVALIVACNTMSRAGKKFFSDCEIPCFFIEPPLERIAKTAKVGKCAVFCTTATARNVYDDLKDNANCFIFPQKRLAAKIEKTLYAKAKNSSFFCDIRNVKINFNVSSDASERNFKKCDGKQKLGYVDGKCAAFLKKFEFVYLCCTHYAYAKNTFEQKFENAKIFDGTENIEEAIRGFLSIADDAAYCGSLFLSKTKFIGGGKNVMKRLYYCGSNLKK